MATPLVLYSCFTTDLINGVHDFDNDEFRVLLSNTAPDVAHDDGYGDVNEITSENGYTANGELAPMTPNDDGADSFVSGSMVTFTASGGSFGPFKYAILINTTSDRLIGYYEYPTSILLYDTEQLTIVYTGGEVLRLSPI